MSQSLVVYIDIKMKEDQTFIIGGHGYLFEKDSIGKKSAKKPTNTTVSNVGYINKIDVKKIKHKEVVPSFFFDFYKTYNCGKDELFVRILTSISRYIKRFKFDKVHLLAMDGKMFKLLKDDSKELRLSFDVSDNQYKKLISMEERKQISFRRVYSYDINAGLQRANIGTIVGLKTGRTLFYKRSDVKYYWTPAKTKDTMLDFRYLIFNTTDTDATVACLANYKKDDPIGLRTSYAAFVSIKFSYPLEEIETLKRQFRKALGDKNVVSVINLDNMYNKEVVSIYGVYGEDIYTIETKHDRVELSSILGELIAYEVKPVGLAIYATQHCADLQTLLKQNKQDTQKAYYLDLTEHFYQTGTKTVINPDLADKQKIKISVKKEDVVKQPLKGEFKFNIFVGTDTPSRNFLKRLETKNPKVFLRIEIKSGVLLETAVIVETDNATMIYCNLNANKIPLKVK